MGWYYRRDQTTAIVQEGVFHVTIISTKNSPMKVDDTDDRLLRLSPYIMMVRRREIIRVLGNKS